MTWVWRGLGQLASPFLLFLLLLLLIFLFLSFFLSFRGFVVSAFWVLIIIFG